MVVNVVERGDAEGKGVDLKWAYEEGSPPISFPFVVEEKFDLVSRVLKDFERGLLKVIQSFSNHRKSGDEDNDGNDEKLDQKRESLISER